MLETVLVDSTVWLEIFLEWELKDVCKRAIASNGFVPTWVYFEVYKKLKIRFSEPKALAAMRALSRYSQVELTNEMAPLAADLSIEPGLGMADSLVLAQAKHLRVPLVTLDHDFAAIPGVKAVAILKIH